MDLVKKLDDIAQKNKIIRVIARFQNSIFYPIMLAIIAVVSGTSGREVYLPCIAFITLCILFSGFFVKDMKVFLAPAFIAFYSVGLDVSAEHYNQAANLPVFSEKSIPYFVIYLALILFAIIFRLYANGVLKNLLAKRGIFFWGIVILSGSMLINGALSPSWKPFDIVYGITVFIILIAFYCIFLTGLSDSKDAVGYACTCLVIGAYTVMLQVGVIAYRFNLNGFLMYPYVSGGPLHFNRGMLCLAWGAAATIPAAIVAMTIPAAMYLARGRRCSLLSYASAFAFLGFCIITRSRGATLFAVLALVACLITVCVSGKNKVKNRIYTACLCFAGMIGVIVYLALDPNTLAAVIDRALSFMRLGSLNDESVTVAAIFEERWEVWKRAISNFLSAPVFGVGFAEGGFTDDIYDNFFRNMYHNIILEFLGSTGVVGTIAFFIHMKHMLEVAVRRRSIEKTLLLCVPLMIIIMSMLDNFFFYPNFQIAYAIFIALAELELERARGERLEKIKPPRSSGKPRVVFTFVEAGKGHIVPTQSVYDAFCQKYGDRADVVKSEFFTETKNEDMQKSEKLFASAVKGMSRTPIMSILCKLGNTIAGDSFAMQVLLSMSVSGRKTAPLAVEHVRELDADVIYTAHWSIPYYVNKLDGNRPYTVCFCPDVYSNGAFNTDCNEFLISSGVGYRRAVGTRMYAGGNVTKIPFPMRAEIMSARGEEGKRSAREQLGITDGEFVVTLSDGGYGVARLEKTVNVLMRSKAPITVIALCGTNRELYDRLSKKEKKISEHVRLIPVSFTDNVVPYIAAADIYAGKSGANSIAEPAALGIPIIVTRCATYIETGIKNYYVRHLGGALYIPNAHRAAKKIEYFASHTDELLKYKKNLLGEKSSEYDATATADILWKRVCEVCKIPE